MRFRVDPVAVARAVRVPVMQERMTVETHDTVSEPGFLQFDRYGFILATGQGDVDGKIETADNVCRTGSVFFAFRRIVRSCEVTSGSVTSSRMMTERNAPATR
jgi:hypothetical protein